MNQRKGQLAPNTIVVIIIAVAVLVAMLLFFTGRFQAATSSFTELTPQEFEVAVSSCQFSCDAANAAVDSTADRELWEARYCNKQVSLGGRVFWCEGMPLNTQETDTYHCTPKFESFECPVEQQGEVTSAESEETPEN